MTEKYLLILEQSLEEKNKLLSQLIQWTMEQKASLEKEPVEWEHFDELIDQKAALIEQLEKMDEGFESVYSRIRESIEHDKNKYYEVIRRLQKKIQMVTDAGASLMALEEQNKLLVEEKLTSERKKIQQHRVSSKAASNYYRNMNKVNFIDPQLMDRKK